VPVIVSPIITPFVNANLSRCPELTVRFDLNVHGIKAPPSAYNFAVADVEFKFAIAIPFAVIAALKLLYSGMLS